MRTIRKNTYWRIKGKILRTSDKAVMVQMSSLQGVPVKTVTWFPRSQIESLTMGGENEEDYFDASEWILEQKGFASDMAKVNGDPQRTVVERFDEPEPSDDELPHSTRRTLDEFEDDIPF